jgi:hypothetical protein
LQRGRRRHPEHLDEQQPLRSSRTDLVAVRLLDQIRTRVGLQSFGGISRRDEGVRFSV